MLRKNNTYIIKKTFLAIARISFYIPLIGMEDYEQKALFPQHRMSFPVFKQSLEISAHSSINICITPDEKAIIISDRGRVYNQSIDSHVYPQKLNQFLFAHEPGRYSTSLAAEKTTRGILVASGTNYCHKKKDQHASQIIVHESVDSFFCVKELDVRLRTLKFAQKGTILVAATPSTVTLYNLENGIHFDNDTEYTLNVEHAYERRTNAKQTKIIDLDIADDYVVIARKCGLLQLMMFNKEKKGLNLLAKVTIKDVITQITLANTRYPFYKTEKNEVKYIDTFDLLDSKKTITPTLFAHSSAHENVFLDHNGHTIALWTKNTQHSDEERSTIIIHYMSSPTSMRWDPEEKAPVRKYYTLHASFNENTGSSLSSEGAPQPQEHNSYFSLVNLCKSTVIALTNTGQLFIWKLPHFPSSHLDHDQKEKTPPCSHIFTVSDTTDGSSETITTTTTTTSTPDSPSLHTHTEKKKGSPRTITLFTSATSRPRSLSSSPFKRSPRSSSSPRSSENQSLRSSEGKEKR